MDLKVTDSKEHILYNKEEAEKGKFAFTTDDQDMFEICFVSNKQGNGFSRGMTHRKIPHYIQYVT